MNNDFKSGQNQLQRKLSLYGLTMIAVGSCIGAGIFLTPGGVVRAVQHPGLVMLTWALGGLIALAGALTFSELGALFPGSGGVYVYLKEAYGKLTGFLYGWVTLLVITTGALAGLCAAFAGYMKIFLPDMSEGAKTGLAAATMLGLTCINMFGVSVSQGMAKFFTGLKLLAMLGIIMAGLVFYDPARIQSAEPLQTLPPNIIAAMLTGLIGVLFSIGGWHHASYVAGEAKDPQRTVPRAMFLGVLIVTVAYLLVNFAYMRLLPLSVIASSDGVAGEAIGTLATWGGKVMAIVIALSIFGSISIFTMSAPRIYYAMAEDGVFFKQLAKVHPRWHTPVNAMLIQVVWALAILLFFQGLFDKIIVFVTFMDIAFMGLAGAAIFIFRKRLPGAERPIKAWGYPVVPFLFVLVSAAFAVNTLLERPSQALPGIGLLLAGVAVYLIIRRK